LSPNGDREILHGEFELFIQLPKNYRAMHMSRNIEAIHEVLWEIIDSNEPKLKVVDLESVCSEIAIKLLEFHDYSEVAFVNLNFQYFLPRLSPKRKILGNESYRASLGSIAKRQVGKPKISFSVGVSVDGATTCPCAQNQAKFTLQQLMSDQEKSALDHLVQRFSFPTHMQRATVSIKLAELKAFSISIIDLIDLAENSMSARTHSLLKRDDEEALIQGAFCNPKFVEDVARDVIDELLFGHKLDIETEVDVIVETQESIHKHNARAEIHSSVFDLLESYKDLG